MPFISGDPIEAASVQQQGTDNMQSTLGQTLGAAVSEGIHDTPVVGISDWVRHRAEALDPNMLTADQANSRYQAPGLKFSAPVSDALANDLYQQKHAQAVRQATMSSGPGGILGGTARIGGGLLPQFLDPLNVASAFVPGMGEARAASILGRFGIESSLATRGLAGVTQGMAGQAALEPLNYGISQDEHNDWTMGQALTNVAFGGLLGGGMHMAFPARELEKAQPTKDTAPTLDDMANPVGEAEWNVLRGTAKEAADGNKHILPAELEHLTEDDLTPLLRDNITHDEARNELQSKLSSYIIDQVREGMTEIDPRTQALMQGSYAAADRVNPVLGQAMRMFMQFKSFPLTHIRRVWGREVTRDGADVAGIAHLIVATTVLGYVAMSLKAMAVGKEPRNPADWRTVLAAMQQGGGAGIYGDFLFGEQSRMGNSFLETLAGPTFSDASSLFKLFANSRDMALGSADAPKGKTFEMNLLQEARRELPFGNLFYTRAALDYLVFYRLQEMMNPGYLRRYELGIQQNQGQKFWLSPTWNPYRAVGQ